MTATRIPALVPDVSFEADAPREEAPAGVPGSE